MENYQVVPNNPERIKNYCLTQHVTDKCESALFMDIFLTSGLYCSQALPTTTHLLLTHTFKYTWGKIEEAKRMKLKFRNIGLSLLIIGQTTLAFAQPTLLKPAFEIPVSKLPLKTFHSKNHKFTAIVCPDDKNIFVFKVNWHGNIGRREKIPLWSTEACFEEVWVANDGQHIIGATYAEGTLPSNYTKEEIIFSFFKNGKSIGNIGLSEIINDLSNLKKTQLGFRWGNLKGFNEAGYLVAETVENQVLMFDPKTGTKIEFRQDQGKVPSDFKTYRDFMNCFEFAYPKDYEMNKGGSLLKRNGTGWLIEINFEDMSQYPDQEYNPQEMTFEYFAIHRAKIMFDADGANGSQYATDVIKKNCFTTHNNLKALEIYLTVVRKTWPDYEDGQEGKESDVEIEKSQEGPIYAVLLSKPGDPYKVLLLNLTDEGKLFQKEKQILKHITNTIKILQ